jgi:hypothetical protein
VAGVLKGYDLPDLIAGIAPRKLIMAGTKNQMLEVLKEPELRKEFEFPLSVFNRKASSEFTLAPAGSNIISLVDSAYTERF